MYLFDFSYSFLCVYQGVMEAIRISCAGYPTKRPFYEFVDRFGILAPEVLDGRYWNCFDTSCFPLKSVISLCFNLNGAYAGLLTLFDF